MVSQPDADEEAVHVDVHVNFVSERGVGSCLLLLGRVAILPDKLVSAGEFMVGITTDVVDLEIQ